MIPGFSSQNEKGDRTPQSEILTEQDQQQNIKDYLRKVIGHLEVSIPDTGPLERYDVGHAPTVGFDKFEPVLSESELVSFLQIDDNDKQELTQKYREYVRLISSSTSEPVPTSKIYTGRGVVYLAGGKHTPMALVGVYLLRKLNPVIPIELFVVNQDEYEADLCEKYLWPKHQIKCRVLTDYFPQSFMDKFEIKGYSLKILALMASSFDGTLMLDADNIPLQNVEQIFVNEPYLSSKYITWPDYWRRTTSPHFYDIIGANVSDALKESDMKWGHEYSAEDLQNVTGRVCYHERQNTMPDVSTESGQLVVSKLSHYQSLLRTLYFNVHGPKQYFPLLTQGAPGQGDKDTFVAGALSAGVMPYRVQQIVRTAGYKFTGGDGERYTKGKGMLQTNPTEDLETNGGLSGLAHPMFLHFQMIKFNMRFLFEQEKHHFVDNSTRVRFCGLPSENAELWDYEDIELRMWQAANWTACGIPSLGYTFQDWKDADVKELCDKTSLHLDWLKSTYGS